MELQEKEDKKIKAHRKPVEKEPANKRCLLILDLMPFPSIGKEFQSFAVQGKKLLTLTTL